MNWSIGVDMWDAYPKDFKGFRPEDLKKQKELARKVKNGTAHPREYDKHVADMKEHEHYANTTKKKD
jgi:hypothetical protein